MAFFPIRRKRSRISVVGVTQSILFAPSGQGTGIAAPLVMPSRLVSFSRFLGVLLSLGLASCSNSPTQSVNDKSNKPPNSGRIKQLSQPTASQPPQDLSANPGVIWPVGMRRLAMLPIHTNRPIDDAQRDMDGIFRGELSKVVKYEIVQVSRQEMQSLLNRESVSSTEIIPAEVVRALRQKYAADAVLFTDFTLFRPYRPLAIGVRTKIVDLRNMDIIWMADGILDSAEPGVADLASSFADAGFQMRYVSPTIPKGRERERGSGNQIILQSPRLYAAFVASEAFATLAPAPPTTPGQ